MWKKIRTLWPALVVGTCASVVTLFNIRHFPMMVGDEGIYVSQAWWLVHFGELGPYTYWYDHFPLGWLLIGLWQQVTGGPFTFGLSVLSGRIFMGLLKGFAVALLYLLTVKISKSRPVALFSAILYALSPLALTFNRQVLLDNVATPFMVASLAVLLSKPTSGLRVGLSSLLLAVAILCKESVLFIVPAYWYTVYALNEHNQFRKYILLITATTTLFFLSLFPLLALLKGELIPHTGFVSLLDTIAFQASRGNQLAFWTEGSEFREVLSVWLSIDPVLIIAGAGTTMLNLILLWRDKVVRSLSLISICFTLFLLRGGVVYDFYLIPLLPLFALNISLLLAYLFKLTQGGKNVSIIIVITFCSYGYLAQYVFTSDATKQQASAIIDLQSKNKGEPKIVTDNFAYLDLSLNQNGDVINPNIFWYSKVEDDSGVRVKIDNNPENIKYLLVNDTLQRKLDGNELPFLTRAQGMMVVDTKFGEPPPPTSLPYTAEALVLYKQKESLTPLHSSQDIIDQHFIIELPAPNLANDEKAILATSRPWAVLIGIQNISNSRDLERFVQDIKAITTSDTRIITIQSDGGSISIPWITNVLRTSYKSSLEAKSATLQKNLELKSLGIDGNVTTSAGNVDNFLEPILQGTKEANITPFLEYIPTQPIRGDTPHMLFVLSPSDLPSIEGSNPPELAVELTSYQKVYSLQATIPTNVKLIVSLQEFAEIRTFIR